MTLSRRRLLAVAVLLGLGLGTLGFSSAAERSAKNEDLGWPFNRLATPKVPAVKDTAWVQSPIDAFILAKLEAEGLKPNPAADRLTLLRRVTYDLTGLAPTPAQIAAFLADKSPAAYETVVDRLLKSPQYGERWAQHWLDVVRYAESEGFKLDFFRADAFRYRDYVIRALNDDLPYDRFIRQQLAGDELEPDNPDALIATGFLRLYPEETNGANYSQIRQDILDDVTDVVGSTFLGLTMSCARCHNHKFDPISQKDYYSLQAFFASMMPRDDLFLAPSETQASYEKNMHEWEAKTKPLHDEMDQMLAPVGKAIFEELVVAFDAETQKAMRMPAGRRTIMQQQLAVLASKQVDRRRLPNRMARRLVGAERARFDELAKKLQDFDKTKPQPLPTAMGVVDSGPAAPPTHRLAGGSYLKPKEEVKPAFLEVLEPKTPEIQPPPARPQSSGRRSALATWLTRPDHPLTSRVIVNRLWQQYFGRGIVGTPNDFGAMGDRATHPELLDYLAAELIRGGWKLKPIHKLIVMSAAYRQSAAAERNPTAATAEAADSDNKLLWHARVRRRDGESIRDVSLQISGQLNARMYGPSALPELPEGIKDNKFAWDPDEKVEDRNRRSVYVVVRRNLAFPMFQTFDAPDRVNSCPSRPTTVTAPQALALLNSDFSVAQAGRMGGLLLARHGKNAEALIREAYLLALNRPAQSDEFTGAEAFLQRQTRLLEADKTAKVPLPEPLPADLPPAYAGAVLDFCHALMNSAEFLYLD